MNIDELMSTYQVTYIVVYDRHGRVYSSHGTYEPSWTGDIYNGWVCSTSEGSWEHFRTLLLPRIVAQGHVSCVISALDEGWLIYSFSNADLGLEEEYQWSVDLDGALKRIEF